MILGKKLKVRDDSLKPAPGGHSSGHALESATVKGFKRIYNKF